MDKKVVNMSEITSWRPDKETWDKSAEQLCKEAAKNPLLQNIDLELLMRGFFEAGANALLEELKYRCLLSLKEEFNG